MRALELQDSDLTFRSDYSEPVPSNDEVNVRILKAGICETDIQLVRGYMEFGGIPGHEFVGIPVSGRFEGRRVVGEINCPCGECAMCKANMPRHCPQRTVVGILNRNGAFADLLTIPETCLHPVPDHVPDELAVFVEPVAAACRIVEQQLVDPNDSVLILGAGRLGNLCAQVLHTRCRELLVVGKHAWKLSKVAECKIESEELQSFVPQAKWDVVVDCTGSPSGLDIALQSVHACGTIVLKTTIAGEQSMHMAPVVIDETRIVGSRCGPFEPALKLISEGQLQLAPMISATYDIEAAIEAFEVSSRSDVLKVQLNLGSDK